MAKGTSARKERVDGQGTPFGERLTWRETGHVARW
jgi:hypothetical protein